MAEKSVKPRGLPLPKLKPIRADEEVCREAVQAFLGVAFGGCPDTRHRYRNLAHAYSLLRAELVAFKEYARKERIKEYARKERIQLHGKAVEAAKAAEPEV